MNKKKLAKNAAVALGFVGLAIAAPHLIPVIALASKDYFGGIFSSLFGDKDTQDSLGKIGVNVLAGVLTNLGSSAAEKIPGALSSEHSFHLETALATTYLESLDALSLKIKAQSDGTLLEQSESVFPLLKARIERALNEKNLDLLFPVQDEVSAQGVPTVRAFANRLSAEDLTLSLADADKMKAMIADDIEITLRRWLNEERAYQGGSLGLGPDVQLPEPLRSYLREELLLELPQRMGEVVKRDDFNKSWLAFQQAHLQAVLHSVRSIEGSHGALVRKVEEVAGLSRLVEEIAIKLSDFLSNARLPQDALGELLAQYREDLAALEGSLYRKIDESTERLSREGGESERRLSAQLREGEEKILSAIQSGRIVIPPTRLHQLPPPSRDFVGREEELNKLLGQARNGVTISGLQGMGGVGKTALALKLADILKADYPDAQFYLDLKGVSPRDKSGFSQDPLDSGDVMWHVISSYNPEAKRPESEEELRAVYYSLLEGKKALLLLDNAKGAEQIEPSMPPVTCFVIATSRQHFALTGMYDLNLEKMSPADAEKLLLKIAPRIGEHAGQIARQCDYLPLALELAAKALVKARTLAPTDLIRQLQDRQKRLGLVEASFSLSYDLLSEEQQRLWRYLAVFPETFDEQAASTLWGVDADGSKDMLAELDGYSLLEWNEATRRFRLHDLARDFADVRLSEQDRETAQRNHAKHYLQVLALANQLYQQGYDSVTQGLALLDLERVNIEAGHAWAANIFEHDSEAASLSVKYAISGRHILGLRQHPNEFIQWYELALGAARKIGARKEEGDCLDSLGLAYSRKGESLMALLYHEQALEIARELNDQKGMEISLGNIGSVYKELSDYRKAIDYHEQAMIIAREIGNRKGEGANLNNMANAYAELGYVNKAIEYLEQALAIAHETGDRRGESIRLSNLGSTYTDIGEYEKAIQCHERSLAISREIGDRRGESQDLGNIGLVYAELGKFDKAAEYHLQALAIARELEDKNGESSDLGNLGAAYLRLGRVEEAMDCFERSIAIARETGNRQNVLTQLGNMGVAYSQTGQAEKGIELINQAVAIAREIGSREGEGNQLGNLGEIYSLMGDTDKAIEFYKAALIIFEEIGSPSKNVVRQSIETLLEEK